MPSWFVDTLLATPVFAAVLFGVGVPWTLAWLPRVAWREHALVAALGLVLGGGLFTGWLFVLGTLPGRWLTLPPALLGALMLATIGGALAWRKRAWPPGAPPRTPAQPWAVDERLLLALVGVALVVRWYVAAYWPFTAYDALWVYGYQGRLYLLTEHIAPGIGYYPPFLALLFTFGQQAIGGVINDHTARAVIPLLHLGSVLAAYVLGRGLSRRAGLLLAALWALAPHTGAWSRVGDLEIPLTMSFTLAAALFLRAWWHPHTPHAGRWALLAGACFGVALWTKPTAGAFALGVILLAVLDLVRARLDVRAWWPRLRACLLTALACAPLGGVWYARNILLGHNAVDFPPDFWPTLAQRSTAQLVWPLAALSVMILAFWRAGGRPRLRALLAGVALFGVALGPSWLSGARLACWAYACLAAAVGVTVWAMRPSVTRALPSQRQTMVRLGWAWALALPYFVTWFVNYSYHYRLGFTIVPLLALPIAVGAGWLLPEVRLRTWRPAYQVGWLALVGALAVPGVIAPLRDHFLGWGWMVAPWPTTDDDKIASGNNALMWLVDGLRVYEQEHGQPPVVSAPLVQRLPFFFPLADIRVRPAPTRLTELAGVTYFVDSSPEGAEIYAHVPPQANQVLAALGREDIMRRAWWRDDGDFRYDIYELHLEDRFTPFDDIQALAPGDAVFGGVVRLLGHNTGGLEFWPGRRIIVNLFWEVLAAPDQDLSVFVHLVDANGTLWHTWDAPIALTPDGRYYTSLVWEPGEFIRDQRALTFNRDDAPLGVGYSMAAGLYNPATGVRVPLVLNGRRVVGDALTLDDRYSIVLPPD